VEAGGSRVISGSSAERGKCWPQVWSCERRRLFPCCSPVGRGCALFSEFFLQDWGEKTPPGTEELWGSVEQARIWRRMDRDVLHLCSVEYMGSSFPWNNFHKSDRTFGYLVFGLILENWIKMICPKTLTLF
jgi:hypothetical protein